MRQCGHRETSMGDADLPPVIRYHFISRVDAESIRLIAGKKASCLGDALMQDQLVNFPHNLGTLAVDPRPCQLGLCSRKLLEDYLFLLLACVRRVQGITTSRDSGVQT
jgi:hypothetical protein